MKILHIILLLLSVNAFAAKDDVDKAFDIKRQNLLPNPGCESGTQRWTPSDTADIAINTAPAAPGYGNQSCVWDANASNDTFKTVEVTQPRAFNGKPCIASLSYLYFGSLASDIRMDVMMNGSSVLKSSATVINGGSLVAGTGSLWQDAALEFECPNSSTATLQLLMSSTVANPGSLMIDNAYLGTRDGLNVVERYFHAVHADDDVGAQTCNISADSTSFVDFATGDADCNFTVIANKNMGKVASWLITTLEAPGIIWTPPVLGNYEVCAKVGVAVSASALSSIRLYETRKLTQIGAVGVLPTANIYSQITVCGVLSVLDYNEIEIHVQAKDAGAGSVSINGNDQATVGGGEAINWYIKKVY